MKLTKLTLIPLYLAVGFAQNASENPILKSQAEYCYHNPEAISCPDAKPIKMIDPSQLGIVKPQINNTTPAWRAKPAQPQAAQTPAATSVSGPPLRVPQPWRKRGASEDIRLGEIDWRLLQDGADMFIGINMSGLAESELARTLVAQWAGKLGATAAEQKQLVAALADIPQAIISIQGKGIVAVLNGRVDNFPDNALVGGLQTFRVSADTVILGTPEAIRWAVWRLNFGLSKTKGILEAQELARGNDFWVCGRPQALAAFGQAMSANTPVSRFRLGVKFKDGFRMDMFLDTNDAIAAAKMLNASTKGAPRGMKAGIEGNTVHYSLSIDRDTALQRFAGFMSEPMGKQFAPLLAAARQMANHQGASSHPAPGKIVIDGLDDGPKEVSVTPRR